MQLFIELGQIFIYSFALAVFMPIFWVVLFLVFMQYRRLAANEEKLFGRVINPIGKQMLAALGYGIVGGFIASAILVLLGLSLEQIGLYFIWPVALLLLLINPRYLCFSYAGGIVAVAVLVFRHIMTPLFPALGETVVVEALLSIHIPALLVLIGLLHLVEALLIYIDGTRGISPVYLKMDSGEVVGAFSLQRFWPIPLVALLVTVVLQTDIMGVTMPEWWPVLQSALQPGPGQSLQYMAVPVAAGLGYADMALTSKPEARTKYTARQLASYSVVLLAIAIGSEFYGWLVLPGVIFAPVGHELLILYGKKKERSEKLLYRSPESGVKLMMVLPGTASADAGLQQDDLITEINGTAVNSSKELMDRIEESYFMVLVLGWRNGEQFSVVMRKGAQQAGDEKELFRRNLMKHSAYALPHRSAEMGLIPVPDHDSKVYFEIKKSNPFASVKRFAGRIKTMVGINRAG